MSIQSYETKKGTKWMYVKTIGKNANGQPIQKRKRGFKKQSEAKKALRELENQLDGGMIVKGGEEVFTPFFTNWMESQYKPRIKEERYENYNYMSNKHIVNNTAFGHKAIQEIKGGDINEFYNTKIEEGLSSSYINDLGKLLKRSFKRAVNDEKIKYNPVDKAEPVPLIRKEIEIWDEKEINTFLNEAKKDRLYICFLIAITTGMRQSEILGLQWKDVDFKKGLLHVRKSLSRKSKGEPIFNMPKTKSSIRSISVSKHVVEELKKHKEKQDEMIEMLGEVYSNYSLVIPSSIGTSMNHRNVLRTMDRLIENCGVKKITFHEMRHTHASLLLGKGLANYVEIKERLGHSDAKITLSIYSHPLSEEKDKVADAFDSLIKK